MSTYGKAQRKEKEFHFRRTEILGIAERHFSAKGFHETTMAEIADASGFSIGSLYHFFRGKEELYSVMVMEKVHQMYEGIVGAVNREESVQKKIRTLVKSHFEYVEHHVDFYRLLVGLESGQRTEGLKKLRSRILEEHQGHVEYIEALLREGIRVQVLRDMNTASLANSLIGIIGYFKFDWIMKPARKSLSEKVDDALDVFLRGAATEEGG